MVRNKHQEDSTDGKEGNNGSEAMRSSFRLQQGLKHQKLTANKFKILGLSRVYV